MNSSSLLTDYSSETPFRRYSEDTGGGQRATILVVDDENGPRQALRVLLNPVHDVLLTTHVDEALEVLGREPVDVVITDMRMPGKSGIELLCAVKRDYPDIEVMILTGYGELGSAMKAVDLGAFAYIEKPFDSEKLLQRVDACVAKCRRERERRSLEQLALRANRFETLGRVVSGMIHDLGTPLSVIGSQVELMTHFGVDEDTGRRLEAIRDQSDHCAEIVRTVMSFLRERPRAHRPVDLNEVVASCLKVSAPLLRHVRVETEEVLANDAVMCQGDFSLVRQAVLNLVTNACHAMHSQDTPRRISLCTWRDSDHVCLSVTDTGPGVPLSMRRKIFDTFFTTKESKGTGLGLGVVDYVMRQHHGRLYLDDNPGCSGAVFVLVFPSREGSAASS